MNLFYSNELDLRLHVVYYICILILMLVGWRLWRESTCKFDLPVRHWQVVKAVTEIHCWLDLVLSGSDTYYYVKHFN